MKWTRGLSRRKVEEKEDLKGQEVQAFLKRGDLVDVEDDELDKIMTRMEYPKKTERKEESQEDLVQSKCRVLGPSCKRGDFKGGEHVLPRRKSCSFEDTNFLEVTRPESRSRKSFVKLWAHQETDGASPKRIKIQISSPNSRDDLSFLESEKAKVIEKITEEHEEKLGSAREARVLKEKRNKTTTEVEDTREKGSYTDPEGRKDQIKQAGRNERGESRGERCRGSKVEKQERAAERAEETKEKRWAEKKNGYEGLTSEVSESGAQDNAKQMADKWMLDAEAGKNQPSAKHSGDWENRGVGILRARAASVVERKAKLRAEPEARVQQRRANIQACLEQIEKTEERATAKSNKKKGMTLALISHPSGPTDTQNVCLADKGTVRRGIGRGMQAEKMRAAKEREDEAARNLQKRAKFHWEALRRIEESFNKRRNIEKTDELMIRYPKGIPLNLPKYWDHDAIHSGLHQIENNQLRKLQKKGKGGLNALLAPAVEEGFQHQFQDMDDIPPEDSYTDTHVKIFQRMKRAQLRAAEEQRAAIEAKAKQRRMQLKPAFEKAEQAKPKAIAREIHRKEKTRDGKSFKLRKNETVKEKLPTKQAVLVPYTYKPLLNLKAIIEPPVRRIKELNEKARADEELEKERRRKAKVKAEAMKARLRKFDPDRESVEAYLKLNTSQRQDKLGQNTQLELKSRYKSPQVACSSKVINRLRSPLSGPQKSGSILKTPLNSQRETVGTGALEHIAKWEKELQTTQRSRARSSEPRKGRRVTIQESPPQKCAKKEISGPKSETGETIFVADDVVCTEEDKNISSMRDQSPVIGPSKQAKPDHYNTVDSDLEECACELTSRKEKTRGKPPYDKAMEIAKGTERREKTQTEALSWLGKFYSTISSLT